MYDECMATIIQAQAEAVKRFLESLGYTNVELQEEEDDMGR